MNFSGLNNIILAHILTALLSHTNFQYTQEKPHTREEQGGVEREYISVGGGKGGVVSLQSLHTSHHITSTPVHYIHLTQHLVMQRGTVLVILGSY